MVRGYCQSGSLTDWRENFRPQKEWTRAPLTDGWTPGSSSHHVLTSRWDERDVGHSRTRREDDLTWLCVRPELALRPTVTPMIVNKCSLWVWSGFICFGIGTIGELVGVIWGFRNVDLSIVVYNALSVGNELPVFRRISLCLVDRASLTISLYFVSNLIHQYKNNKLKLHKVNAAIWYNKTCKIKGLTPKL
jgi:hypothetical protein